MAASNPRESSLRREIALANGWSPENIAAVEEAAAGLTGSQWSVPAALKHLFSEPFRMERSNDRSPTTTGISGAGTPEV